jgi:hypothetical protein
MKRDALPVRSRQTRSHVTRPSRAAGMVGLWLVLAAGCTAGVVQPISSARQGSGLEMPKDPYGPFPYASGVQKEAFRSFLMCAQEHGVHYEGPYADSRGKGAMIRPAAGETISEAERAKVSRLCPQFMVATAATPHGSGAGSQFEGAMVRFVRCLRKNGYPYLTYPSFGTGDPYRGIRLELPWESERFVRAATRCIQPIRDFVFSG